MTSIEQARYKRDLLAEADDHYWASLTIAEEAQPSSSRETSEDARRRYRMATVKVLASGFTDQPIDHLATVAPLEEALARLLAVHQNADPAEIPRERDAEALLGGAPKPAISVSEAFEVYVGEINLASMLRDIAPFTKKRRSIWTSDTSNPGSLPIAGPSVTRQSSSIIGLQKLPGFESLQRTFRNPQRELPPIRRRQHLRLPSTHDTTPAASGAHVA